MPNETKRLEIIDLDNAKSVTVRLDEGRRTELAVVSPANLKRPVVQDEERELSGYEKLRRLSYPTTTGGGIRTGAAPHQQTPAPNNRSAQPSTIGVNRDVRIGADTRNLNVPLQPLQSLTNARAAVNLSVVPGSR